MSTTVQREENLKTGAAASFALHAVIVGFAIFWGYVNFGPRDVWGDANAIPGAGFAVTPVDRIPLPSRNARPNPKADDSESDTAEPLRTLLQIPGSAAVNGDIGFAVAVVVSGN